MKSVLLLDANHLFKDLIKEKISSEQVELTEAFEERDAFPKMLSILPNLIILNREEESARFQSDFLDKKAVDANAAKIPIIMTGPKIDKSLTSSLARFGVVKYFTKPIKFDLFFEAVSKILNIQILLDKTPCVLDVHKNGQIIFIEIAQGLNIEKLALLKLTLSEMIEKADMAAPKIVIMLSNLELSFIDGVNLEFLLENVLGATKVQAKNVKILSLSNFVHEFVSGHEKYNGIEVSKNLARIMTSIADPTSAASVADLIAENILSGKEKNTDSSVETRFYSDVATSKNSDTIGSLFSVAIVDSDSQSASFIKNTFKETGAKIEVFSKGQDFLDSYSSEKFNLIILDVLISDSSGFEVLKKMRSDPGSPPVIVYSESAKRELIVKVLSFGTSVYLMKPQKPEVLLEKAFSVLNKK